MAHSFYQQVQQEPMDTDDHDSKDVCLDDNVTGGPTTMATPAGWVCTLCTFQNADVAICEMCNCRRPLPQQAAANPTDDDINQMADDVSMVTLSGSPPSDWKCTVCSAKSAGGAVCEACGAEREPEEDSDDTHNDDRAGSSLRWVVSAENAADSVPVVDPGKDALPFDEIVDNVVGQMEINSNLIKEIRTCALYDRLGGDRQAECVESEAHHQSLINQQAECQKLIDETRDRGGLFDESIGDLTKRISALTAAMDGPTENKETPDDIKGLTFDQAARARFNTMEMLQRQQDLRVAIEREELEYRNKHHDLTAQITAAKDRVTAARKAKEDCKYVDEAMQRLTSEMNHYVESAAVIRKDAKRWRKPGKHGTRRIQLPTIRRQFAIKALNELRRHCAVINKRINILRMVVRSDLDAVQRHIDGKNAAHDGCSTQELMQKVGGVWARSLYPDGGGAAPPPPHLMNPNMYAGQRYLKYSDTDDDDAAPDEKEMDFTTFHGTRNRVAERARTRREAKRERGIARDEQRRAAEQRRREEARRQSHALHSAQGHYDHHVVAPPQMPKLEAASDAEHFSRSPLGMARAAAADRHAAADHHAAASHMTPGGPHDGDDEREPDAPPPTARLNHPYRRFVPRNHREAAQIEPKPNNKNTATWWWQLPEVNWVNDEARSYSYEGCNTDPLNRAEFLCKYGPPPENFVQGQIWNAPGDNPYMPRTNWREKRRTQADFIEARKRRVKYSWIDEEHAELCRRLGVKMPQNIGIVGGPYRKDHPYYVWDMQGTPGWYQDIAFHVEADEFEPFRERKNEDLTSRVSGFWLMVRMGDLTTKILAPWGSLLSQFNSRLINGYTTHRTCDGCWNMLAFEPSLGPVRWRFNIAIAVVNLGTKMEKPRLEATAVRAELGGGRLVRCCDGKDAHGRDSNPTEDCESATLDFYKYRQWYNTTVRRPKRFSHADPRRGPSNEDNKDADDDVKIDDGGNGGDNNQSHRPIIRRSYNKNFKMSEL